MNRFTVLLISAIVGITIVLTASFFLNKRPIALGDESESTYSSDALGIRFEYSANDWLVSERYEEGLPWSLAVYIHKRDNETPLALYRTLIRYLYYL